MAPDGHNLDMAYGPPPTFDPTNVMGRRIGAWVIDALIPTVIALVVGWAIFSGSATKFTAEPQGFCSEVHLQQPGTACVQLGNDVYVGTSDDAHHALEIGGLIYLVGAVNLFLVQGLTGAAIGKHMLGLRVVRADGSLVGFGWNALRTLLLAVDQFFCALPGIITAGVTHPHRRVGDFAAGTFVVAKESVGTPIGVMAGASAYPPPWTPPGGPVGWGPPPGGEPQWGAPQSGAPQWGAPVPGWGSPQPQPPGQAPTPSGPAAAPTWGSPAADPQATPPPAQTPTTWGAPVPDDPPAQQPAPQPVQPPAQQPAPQPMQAASGRAPQWDAQRNAWVFWEVETNRWL
jgi:uncharacterized RDD family membrane protein YckC